MRARVPRAGASAPVGGLGEAERVAARVEQHPPGLAGLLVGQRRARARRTRRRPASRSSTARSRWNCLVPCSFGQPGGSWSSSVPNPRAIPPGPVSIAYSSCAWATSQPSTADQNVASRRASELSRVSIFSAAIAMVVPLVGVVGAGESSSLPRLGRCPIGQRRHARGDGLDGGGAAARRVRPPRRPRARAGRAVGRALGREPLVAALGPARRAARTAARCCRTPPAPSPSSSAATREPGCRPARPSPSPACAPVASTSRCAGWGRVVGVRFRPGGLAALTGARHPRGPTGRCRPREVLPAGAVRDARRPRPRGIRSAWARRPKRAWPRSPTSAPTPGTTCCSRWWPTCSPTARCSRWPRSPSGTASRSAACSGCSRTTWGSARSGCSPATGCTTPSPTSTPGGTARSPTSPALRLVRPGPLHPRLHRPGRGHAAAVPLPRGRVPGIRAALTCERTQTFGCRAATAE